jgi:glycosyltransferase involved in cell wall biosynthesis
MQSQTTRNESLLKDPLVSVITPVYNGKQWISRTIESVRAQTYPHIEIIVVDDGSTDETAAIVEAAVVRDTRIRLFRKANSGVSDSRNFGLVQARGSLIAPLDADDLWHPKKLAQQVATMQASSPKVGVIYCWSVEIDEDDFIIPPIRVGSTAEGDVIAEVVANVGIMDSGSIPLIRRSYLEAIGGYDPDPQSVEELWKLSMALSQVCEFAVVPKHLVAYRRSASSNSRKVSMMERSLEHVSGWIMNRWPDMPQDVRQHMIYNINSYLAHQALTNNDRISALRYKIKGCKTRPSALLEPAMFVFAARLIARTVGMSRNAWPICARPLSFNDFLAKSELTAEP